MVEVITQEDSVAVPAIARPDLEVLRVWIENGRNPDDLPPGYDVSGYLTPTARELLVEGIQRINRLDGDKRQENEKLRRDWYYENWMIDSSKSTKSAT